LSNADWWQTAGNFNGAGVSIGHIDSYDDVSPDPTIASLQASGDWPPSTQVTLYDFKDYSGPTLCAAPGFGCEAIAHGDATMELLYDFAPGATYFAYDTYYVSDWYNAILDAANVGNGTTGTLGTILGPPKVNVISASLGAPVDSIGDGTAIPGSIAEAAGFAKANGVALVNAAGNQAQAHWGGNTNYSTTGGNAYFQRWMPGQTFLPVGPDSTHVYCIPAGFELAFSVSWDDWAASGGQFAPTQDYRLILYRATNSTLTTYTQVAFSDDPQDGTAGERPQEFIDFTASGSTPGCGAGSGVYGIRVLQNASTHGATNYLQVFDEVGYGFSFPTSPNSLGFPADSPNVISVGAIDRTTPTTIEAFSSRGPTLGPGGGAPIVYTPISSDPNVKPDIAQFDNVRTVAEGAGFSGTSAATPEAAGMIAQAMQRFGTPTNSADVDNIAGIVHSIASTGPNDLGTADVDYTYGWGRFKFQQEASLVFEQQPTDTDAAQIITPNISVGVVDNGGRLVRYGIFSDIALAIGTNPPGDGDLSQTSAPISTSPVSGTTGGGVATFNSASIDKAGVGYTVVASVGSLPAATSDAFNINVGAAASMSFSTQPSDVVAGATMTPPVVVHVQDAGGNPVVAFNVNLTIDTGPSGGTLNVTTPEATDSNGNATFSDLSLQKAGAYTLKASGITVTPLSAISDPFNVTAAAASVIAFTTQPASGSDVVANTAIPVAVNVQDAFGNPVTNDSVTLGLNANPGSSTLTVATNPVSTDTDGNATFSGVSLDKAGIGYSFSASDGIATTAVSNSFNVVAGAAATMSFSTQPSDTQINTLQPVVVHVQDASGNPVPGDSITLTIATGPAGATLTGGGPVASDASGNASFSISVDEVGAYTLQAGDGTLTATSNSFNAAPGPATQLFFTTEPVDIMQAGTEAVDVAVEDASGNIITTDETTVVTLQVQTSCGLLTLGSQTVVDGVASFSGLQFYTVATGLTLQATSDTSLSGTSSAFDVTTNGDILFADGFESCRP
jgi:hypothetical protein